MQTGICPADELVEIDLEGFTEGQEFTEEQFALDGRRVEASGSAK